MIKTAKISTLRLAITRNARNLSFTTLVRSPEVDNSKIKTLEDLTRLETLEGVDPELIKRLINEKTQEFNTQDELKLLKSMQMEQDRLNEVPLKRFTRPLWIFILMASTFYLGAHLVWWKLAYEKKVVELKHKVDSLETTLKDVMKEKAPGPTPCNNKKSWYKFW